ncbi:hypothetical protein PIB30_089985 [Stylosanthes scabra]|uniref:Zinc finger GRF-type domain-containing protein n=1 Tax=Stylosanthes scabra TaxID=79078 RepID=A0ABU6YVK5_9FABA|nr:hypothetical protein [Stylosanthes scabra]
MASRSSNSRASRCSHPSSESNTLLCEHGIKPVLRVSHTKENPGRRFWGCANYQTRYMKKKKLRRSSSGRRLGA